MKKVSFSIPSAKPQSKPEPVNTFADTSTSQNDTSKPTAPRTLIPSIQNQWKPLNPRSEQHNGDSAVLWRRTPVETELLRKLKLKEDLQRLPEEQGLQEFDDVPVAGFGAALLAGYGWSEGMGIGKNAKEDVKVAQIKRRTAGEGLGFVCDASIPTSNANLNRCSREIRHLQL
ncbi:hypothetical protein Fmac_007318 [Flemingia macrophylla]|uniref:G-patch domain-containing protein n=1 Tax=Flemingia macrophylla TaxID=520843 RepID=A0ABD1MV95_9FABA